MFKQIGPTELLIVLAIVILIFGVGRLGKLGKELGTGIREFREGIKSDKEEGEGEEAAAEAAAVQAD